MLVTEAKHADQCSKYDEKVSSALLDSDSVVARLLLQKPRRLHLHTRAHHG